MLFPAEVTPENDSQEQPTEKIINPFWLDLFVQSLNNLAASHLQNEEPLRAREACIKALEVNPENVTTLLRAGRYINTNNVIYMRPLCYFKYLVGLRWHSTSMMRLRCVSKKY